MTIHDEFTDMPVSRERRRQLRKIAKGLCQIGTCQNPLQNCSLCKEHIVAAREMSRRRRGAKRRNLKSKSYGWENNSG
jgi:hypothetical protein